MSSSLKKLVWAAMLGVLVASVLSAEPSNNNRKRGLPRKSLDSFLSSLRRPPRKAGKLSSFYSAPGFPSKPPGYPGYLSAGALPSLHRANPWSTHPYPQLYPPGADAFYSRVLNPLLLPTGLHRGEVPGYPNHKQSTPIWPFSTYSKFYPYRHQDSACTYDKPFLCWGSSSCIRISGVCDGVFDCENHFDEDPQLCIAGKRPSEDNLVQFLTTQKGWILNNLFNNAAPKAIAEALRFATSVEELRWRLDLTESNVNKTRMALQAVKDDNSTPLVDMGMASTAWETVKYLFKTLLDTGLSVG